jgi:hypothetical protein
MPKRRNEPPLSASDSKSPNKTNGTKTTDPRLKVVDDALAKAVAKRARTPPSKVKQMDETIDHLLDMRNNVLRDQEY